MAATTPTYKLLLIGESKVGKSSIINRFAGDDFTETTMSTVGVDFRNREMLIDGKNVKLQIWDSAGQERFRTIVTSYFRGAHGVMVVYDVTHRGSFEKVKEWMDQLDQHAAETVCRVLVGNKTDLAAAAPEKRQVATEEGQALADQLQVPFIETSAKKATNVEEAFIALTRQVRLKVKTVPSDPQHPQRPARKPINLAASAADDGEGPRESCC